MALGGSRTVRSPAEAQAIGAHHQAELTVQQ